MDIRHDGGIFFTELLTNDNEEIQVPAGIFLPTIAIGASFGRVVGLLTYGYQFYDPGLY
jgi:hypothetical protein